MVGSLMNIMDVYPPEKKKALEDKGINGVTGGFFGRPFDLYVCPSVPLALTLAMASALDV